MTTKPTDLVRFAVDGSDVNASNISAPVSGVRDVGFLTNGILPSGNLNYFLNGYYRWLQYLNAGAFQGASSFDSTLSITGLLTLIAGATASVNQSFTVSGTGQYKHPSKELDIDACSYVGDSNASRGSFDSTGHFVSTFTGAGVVCAPVKLEVGKRILSFQQYYSVNNTGATLTPRLRRIAIATATITDVWVGTGDNTGGAGVIESQTGSALNHTVLSGNAYFAEVTVTNNSHRVYGGVVTYDQP